VEANSHLLRQMPHFPPSAANRLAQIQIPIRFAVGDMDAMVSIEETLAVQKQVKQGSLLVAPATRHPIDRVDAGRMAFEISEFFIPISENPTP
jgi:flagellar biosynthesis/type III secretory pathway ATPase